MHFFKIRNAARGAIVLLLGVIISGTFLLRLPGVLRDGLFSWSDAFFMASSATTVTGVAIMPFDQFTFFGQCILLILIQIGGIGITTILIGVAISFARSGMGWQDFAMQMFEIMNLKKIKMLIRSVAFTTLIVELSAATIFYCIACYTEMQLSFFHALFQSINLFCNAGFLLTGAAHEVILTPLGMIIGAAVIMMGSLGFLFFLEIFEYCIARYSDQHYAFSLTFRVGCFVYCITAFFAFVVFLLFSGSCVESLFYAVSLRGCGMMASHRLQEMPGALILFSICYSFFGGLPFSTSSGLKTSIIGVLLVTFKSLMAGAQEILFFGRSLLSSMVIKAHAFCLYFGGVILLLALVVDFFAMHEFPFFAVIVEIIGMMTNSGITFSLAPYLSSLTLFVLSAAMIVGRIGILMFLLRVHTKSETAKHPEGDLMLL